LAAGGLDGCLRHQHRIELGDSDRAGRSPLLEPLAQVPDVLHLLVAQRRKDPPRHIVLGVLDRNRVGPVDPALVLEGDGDGLFQFHFSSQRALHDPTTDRFFSQDRREFRLLTVTQSQVRITVNRTREIEV
jgi:hypothetical protein